MRTSELLDDITRAIGAPTYQARYSPSDILKIASSQQKSFVVPEIRSLRKSHFLKNEDFAVVTGDTSFPLPARAIGRTVYKVLLTTVPSPTVTDFNELKLFEVSELLSTRTSTGNTFGYYFEDDKIMFHPALAQDSTLRLYYLFRPGELVLESKTATILNVGTDTLTLDATPANITLGNKIDVVRVEPGFETLCKDLVITARSSTSITVAGYDFSVMDISVGDSLSLSRQTSVVQLPEDAHDVLVWATASEIATGLGVDSIIAQAEMKLRGAVMGMRDALSPRSEDPQTIINPRNLLRSGGTRLGSILR